MVVPHVLRVFDESRGDSLCQVLLVSSSNSLSCLSIDFCFFLHDLPGILDTDHVILWVQLLHLTLPNLSAKLLPRAIGGK